MFSGRTLEAEDAAFMPKLVDIVRAAVDEARFATAIDKLRGGGKRQDYGSCAAGGGAYRA